MKSTICTLFEGDYHKGLAALVNSLCAHQFQGDVFAGYRGDRPSWAKDAKANTDIHWANATTLKVTADVDLHFIPLSTDYHFTNYKPDFMLEIMDKCRPSVPNLFYFDPDIVLVVPFNDLLTWLDAGVALCEDVNSPLAPFHPKRVAWRTYFAERELRLSFKDGAYANGGFVGVKRSDIAFVQTWKQIQELMAPAIGGLSRSSLKGQPIPASATTVFAPFSKTDQDALNATVEAFEGQVSMAGKEAMAFIVGRAIMPHALGQPKPWNISPIQKSFTGYAPRLVEKVFWNYVLQPIGLFSKSEIDAQKRKLRIAAFISRFYTRN